jgi:hypothetical protein
VVTAFDDTLTRNESADSAEVSATPEVVPLQGDLFGSDNAGYAGFTTSTPGGSNETWSLEGDSVQYRNQNSGTYNSSLLREFVLDRSAGRSYRVEGVVTLTDGYADDNNRVGLYLFGDFPEVPNQDEAGAIGLIFNMDDSVTGGAPGNNAQDNIALRVGIDNTLLSDPAVLRDQTVPFAQDLFGTTITLAADITFIAIGTNEFIQIDASLTAAGAKTTVSTTVLAADYTGDYFGFVTRARARNYPDTAANRGAPWVMDYRSFAVSELTLAFSSITGSAATPGQFDFAWKSQSGKSYDLVSDTTLSTPASSWPVWQGYSELLSSGTGINTLTRVPGGGGGARFFALVQKNAPPLLEEQFDAAAALPAGWTTTGPSNGTDWEVGSPAAGVSTGPDDAQSPPNCAGTNIDDYYTENADVSLISPSFAVPPGLGALLTFNQWIDTDLFGNPPDRGSVRVLDADNADTPIPGLEILGIEGDGGDGWTLETLALPSGAVGGKNIKVEFRFESNAGSFLQLDVWSGFYVDDVLVTVD